MEWWGWLILLVICTIGECIVGINLVNTNGIFEYKKYSKEYIIDRTLGILNFVFIMGIVFFGIFVSSSLTKKYPSIEDNSFLVILTCVGPVGVAFGVLYLFDYWWKGRDDRISRRRERKKNRKNREEEK